MNYRQAQWKRRLEAIPNAPFIWLGKWLGYVIKKPADTRYFLFFPSADIGGSPKVNADILQLIDKRNPLVIFSKKAKNNGFYSLFYREGITVLDLSKQIDNKGYHVLNIIWRGILSTWINQTPEAIILGGECIYFYKIVQHIKPSVRVIEVSHLNTWLNFNQAYIPFIDYRIVSTPKLKRYFEQQYASNGVPNQYLSRLQFIDNWVDIPALKSNQHEGLKVLFVGRGAPQKRVPIISAIAEELMMENRDFSFTFVGDVMPLLSPFVQKHATIYEFVQDKDLLASLYDDADVLILTSAYEGLPIVVMDMMARGKVVISTAVDGIPDYIHHMENGLLIHELIDEEKIKLEAIQLLTMLAENPSIYRTLGDRARELACHRFSRKSFETSYSVLLDIPTRDPA